MQTSAVQNPKISVVMSVFNGADVLASSINSVLSQTWSDFEFIIINDGSTDESQLILEGFQAADSRIVIIQQDNQGLTKALMNGCALAKGQYIARQDNGDVSLPDRFSKQVKYLEEDSSIVMVSSATTFVGPNGEDLYTVTQSSSEADNGIRVHSEGLQTKELSGPAHHGSVMFRKASYDAVGGYRAAFRVAQDLDLWTRLADQGKHFSLASELYRASLAKNSISVLQREKQVLASSVILSCCLARKKVGNDKAVIKQYLSQQQEFSSQKLTTRQSDAAYYYFIASNLFNKNLSSSLKYLKQTIKNQPFHIKAWCKLFWGLMKHFLINPFR